MEDVNRKAKGERRKYKGKRRKEKGESEKNNDIGERRKYKDKRLPGLFERNLILQLMELINRYKLVIAFVLLILIPILIRSLSGNHFKPDAKRWAEPSVSRSNLVTSEQAVNLPGKKIAINLGNMDGKGNKITNDVHDITPDSILSKKYLDVIRKNKGPVLLLSSETGVAARLWMVLHQMGYTNVYILTSDSENEVLKYKFRTDTLTRPEL
jgi:hypothetical protein